MDKFTARLPISCYFTLRPYMPYTAGQMVVQMRKPQISLLDGLNAPNRNRPLPISSVYTRTYGL